MTGNIGLVGDYPAAGQRWYGVIWAGMVTGKFSTHGRRSPWKTVVPEAHEQLH